MNIYEAEAIAKTGQRFRRAASTSWFSIGDGDLWYIQPQGEAKRVVRSSDFTAANFFATDYTTDLIADGDVCSMPGAVRPQFDAPSVSLRATRSGGTLSMVGVIGAGSFGAYNLTYLVDGAPVAHQIANSPGEYSKSTPTSGGVVKVTLRAESVLPLEPWIYEVSVTLRAIEKIVLTASGLSVTIAGPRPFSDTCNGSLEAPFSPGTDLYTIFGSIGNFSVSIEYRFSTNMVQSFSISTSGAVWWASNPADLSFPKASSVSIPQFSGTVWYDEAGYYDQPSEGGVNTSYTDGGLLRINAQ